MIEEVKGLVFDIQGYSVHDGPGGRTLVFMKGCPLSCEWCSNPEGMRAAQDIMFRNTKCVHIKNGCSRCLQACPHGAISVNPDYASEDDPQLLFDRRLCNQCTGHECLEVCYFEGIRHCGEWKTVPDLMHIFHRNRHYWGANGGVSFSGGEPLLQARFVQTVLEACRQEKMHTAVETTAFIQPEVFLNCMQFVDFAFIDVKHMNSHHHREKTGVPNELIHKNLAALAASDWHGRLILRMPLIAGYNDGEENIQAIAEFMNHLGLVEINVLPFHRLGDSKWNQLGKEYAYRDCSPSDQDQLYAIQDLFLNQRIACYVGSETPF